MRKIQHLTDSTLDTKLVGDLSVDNDTIIYDELSNKAFRFVKPTDANQTFGNWKINLPRYDYQYYGGTMIPNRLMDSLSASYSLFDQTELFTSDFASQFTLQTNVYWQKKIGGSATDEAFGVVTDSSNNVYVCGTQGSDTFGGSSSVGVVKLDSNGTIVWQKKIGGNSGYAAGGRDIALDSSNNIYVCGYQTEDSYGSYDLFVCKLQNDGNLLWQKKIGGLATDFGFRLTVDSSGNVYIVGYQQSNSYGNSDITLIKLSQLGGLIWQKKIGGVANDYGYDVDVDSSDNIYVTGSQNSDTYGSSDVVVVKFAPDGTTLWQKKIGGTSSESGQTIHIDNANNIYVAGSQHTDSFGNGDVGLIKMDNNGNILSHKKIGGLNNDIAISMTSDSSNNIYINGYQNSDAVGGSNHDFCVIKLDSNSNILWQKKIGGTASDNGRDITVSADGNILVAGNQASDTYGNGDYGVMKLNPSQPSDMNLSIDDTTLSSSNSGLSIGDASLNIGNSSLSIGNSALSIGDVDISGEVGGLSYSG